MSDVRELYQAIIVEHGTHPRNCRRLDDADAQAAAHNPMCGDDVAVSLSLDGGRIREAAFQGRGCAIAMASASLMTESVTGAATDEAVLLGERFRRHVTGEDPGAVGGDLAAFSGVSRFPARITCALLPWRALRDAIGVAIPSTPRDKRPHRA